MTAIDLPDKVMQRVRITVAERGQSLGDVIIEALGMQVIQTDVQADGNEPLWMEAFGKLSHLSEETRRIQALIDEEFECIEPKDSP